MFRRTPLPLLLLLAGCAPAVQSVSFGSGTAASPPSDAPVRVYGEQRPRCPVQEVGLVTGSPANGWQSGDRVLAAMRQRAREMGGDAIVGLTSEQVAEGSSGVVVNGTGAVAGSSTPVWKGTVVRFTDPSCAE